MISGKPGGGRRGGKAARRVLDGEHLARLDLGDTGGVWQKAVAVGLLCGCPAGLVLMVKGYRDTGYIIQEDQHHIENTKRKRRKTEGPRKSRKVANPTCSNSPQRLFLSR